MECTIIEKYTGNYFYYHRHCVVICLYEVYVVYTYVIENSSFKMKTNSCRMKNSVFLFTGEMLQKFNFKRWNMFCRLMVYKRSKPGSYRK